MTEIRSPTLKGTLDLMGLKTLEQFGAEARIRHRASHRAGWPEPDMYPVFLRGRSRGVQRIAIGRTGEPVAPLNRMGVTMNRNSLAPSATSSSNCMFSRLKMPFFIMSS